MGSQRVGRDLATEQYHHHEQDIYTGFPGGSVVKNPPVNAGEVGSIPGLEDPLEKEMATHSSILDWELHGQRSLAGYSPMGHKRVGYDLVPKQQQRIHGIVSLSSL